MKTLVSRGETVKSYLPVEEIYDVIEAAHLAVGHGGRDRLKMETARKNASVTIKMLNTFLSMCETCQQKRKTKKKKGLVSKPILHSDLKRSTSLTCNLRLTTSSNSLWIIRTI
jgi:hypothetical protein